MSVCEIGPGMTQLSNALKGRAGVREERWNAGVRDGRDPYPRRVPPENLPGSALPDGPNYAAGGVGAGDGQLGLVVAALAVGGALWVMWRRVRRRREQRALERGGEAAPEGEAPEGAAKGKAVGGGGAVGGQAAAARARGRASPVAASEGAKRGRARAVADGKAEEAAEEAAEEEGKDEVETEGAGGEGCSEGEGEGAWGAGEGGAEHTDHCCAEERRWEASTQDGSEEVSSAPPPVSRCTRRTRRIRAGVLTGRAALRGRAPRLQSRPAEGCEPLSLSPPLGLSTWPCHGGAAVLPARLGTRSRDRRGGAAARSVSLRSTGGRPRARGAGRGASVSGASR